MATTTIPANLHSLLPTFSGDDEKVIKPADYVELVNNVRETNGWDDKATARGVALTFRGEATGWCKLLRIEQPEALDSWKKLEKAFRLRYRATEAKVSTNADTAADNMTNLKQRPGETVMAFVTRVKLAVLTTTQPITEDEGQSKQKFQAFLTENNFTTQRADMEIARKFFVRLTSDRLIVAFLGNGLRGDIKEKVTGMFNPAQDYLNPQALIDAATRAEAQLIQGSKLKYSSRLAVSQVQEEATEEAVHNPTNEAADFEDMPDDEVVTVAAMKRFMKAKANQKPQAQKKKNTNQGKTSKPKQNNSEEEVRPRCNFCYIFGHEEAECRTKARIEDNKKGKSRQNKQRQSSKNTKLQQLSSESWSDFQ